MKWIRKGEKNYARGNKGEYRIESSMFGYTLGVFVGSELEQTITARRIDGLKRLAERMDK